MRWASTFSYLFFLVNFPYFLLEVETSMLLGDRMSFFGLLATFASAAYCNHTLL